MTERPRYEDQGIPTAEIHDDGTCTVAVTFRWRAPWAMDKCEVGVIVGELTRATVEHFKDYEQLAALESVRCWDPSEELLIGALSTDRPILFPSGERELTDRDRELDQAWRDLRACVDQATYAAHGGEFGSLPMMADAGRGIAAALAIIWPHKPGNTHEWTAIDRHTELDLAIRSSHRQQVWTADSLNAACSSALRITAGWDQQRHEFAA